MPCMALLLDYTTAGRSILWQFSGVWHPDCTKTYPEKCILKRRKVYPSGVIINCMDRKLLYNYGTKKLLLVSDSVSLKLCIKAVLLV